MDAFDRKDINDLGYDSNLQPTGLQLSPIPIDEMGDSPLDKALPAERIQSGDLSEPIYSGKDEFVDSDPGWRQGRDPLDKEFKWVLGADDSQIDFNVTERNKVTIGPGVRGVNTAPLTAAEAITAGQVVSLQSDGQVHVSDVTDLSAFDAATAISSAPSNLTNSRPSRSFEMSNTVKTLLTQVASLNQPILFRTVVDPTVPSVTSGTNALLTSANGNNWQDVDGIKLTDTTMLVAYNVFDSVLAGYRLRCKVVTTSATIAQAAEATSAQTINANSNVRVERFSDTEAIVFFYDGTDLKAQQITISGTTPTFGPGLGTVATNTNRVEALVRFGTSDYYAFLYSDTAPSLQSFVRIAQYNGSFTFGTAVQFTANYGSEQDAVGIGVSDTMILIANITGAAYTGYLRTITRSGTAATINTSVSYGNFNTGYAYRPNLNAYGTRFLLGVRYYDGAQKVAFAIYKVVGTVPTLVGNRLLTSPHSFIFGGPVGFSSSKILAFLGTSATAVSAYPISTVNNYAEVVGVAAEDIAAASSGSVYYTGVADGLSGLTPGLDYYTYPEGQVTNARRGGGTLVGRAVSATQLFLKL